MELLIQAKKHQPELYAQIEPTQKMSLGIYEGEKAHAIHGELSADEVLRLRGLKLSIASDNLTPNERITKSIEILNLEGKNK